MLLNWRSRELQLKVVYYGPALSGKTTNLKQIYSRIDPAHRSEMVSLQTKDDRTLYFDFLQLELGKICGLKPLVQLYTVPGQSYYEVTRRLVLRGVDGIVFIADSEPSKVNENYQTWQEMFVFLKDMDLPADEIGIVVQYNKRDIPNAVAIPEMKRLLGDSKYPSFEAIAVQGVGVYETFRAILNLTVQRVQKLLQN
jgi:signal recognition particle receptor subunit beta